MKRILSIVLVWIALLMMGGDAFEGVAFGQLTSGYLGVDSSEKVSSLLKTAITSGQTPPFGIKITSGDGPKFAHVGSYFIATLDVASPTNLSAIEEVLVRYASGDSLTVLARGTSVAKNRPAQAWAINSYFGIRVSYVVTKQIVDSLKKRATMLDSVAHRSDSVAHLLPAFAAQSGKVLSNNGTNLFWTSAAGAVSSITATTPLTGGTITTTGAIGIAIADAAHTGAISNTDWSTLMAKQDALPSLVASRVLSNDGSSLVWSTAGAGTVTSVSGSGGSTGLTVSNVPITIAGTFTLGGTLVIANGGTGAGNRAQALLNLAPPISGKIGNYLRISPVDSSIIWDTASGSGAGLTNPMTTTGDLIYASNTAVPATAARLAIGAQDSIPLVVTTGLPSWGGKPVRVTNGGTGQATLTSHSLLVGEGTAKVVSLGSATNGQIPIGSTGADPVLAALTAGTGVSVTNGAGSITIANTGVTSVAASGPSGILTWSSAVTTTGTLTATAASQAANTFWGAPDGSSGTPTFRTLVAADIPPISAADITSGVLAVANGGTGQSSYTNGQLLIGNTSGNTLAKATLTGTTDEVNITNGGGTITLSTPQAIATTSSPTFAGLDISTGGAYTINSTSVLNATTLGSGVAASSLTSVGTIATGVWHGTPIATSYIADSNVTAVKIATHAVDLTQQVSGILPAANGGTGNGFTAFTGPATSTKTFTLPNASATLAYLAGGQTFTGGLTINGGLTLGTALAVTSGGTGLATLTSHAIQIGNGTSSPTQLGLGTSTTVLHGAAAGDPTWGAVSLTADVTGTLPVANGGSGATSITSNRLLLGRGTAAAITLADDSLGVQLASNKVLISNGASNDPFFGISTLGASFAVNLDTMANRTGGTTGTLTKRLGIQPGTLSPTAPLFACVQKNSTSTASVYYQVLVDSSTRSTGLNAIAHKGASASSFNNNEGISVGYVFGVASSNGIAYANQAEVESPGAQGSYDTVITDARLAASSVLIVSCEKSAASLSARWYVPYIKARAAGSWTYRLTQDITNADQAMAALEGCRVNYGTFVTTPDRKVVAGRDSAVCPSAGQNGLFDTITCAEANANSTVLTTLEANAQTPTTTDISFYATPEPPANWPAGKFIVRVQQAHGSGNHINAGNSLTVNWVVINATNTNAQPNWTFAGAPVAITNTSNQIVLGTTTTTTLNATAPAASAVYTVPDVGTTAKFAMSVNGIKIPDTASSGGKFLAAGTGGGAPTWSTVTGSGITGVRGGVFGGSTTGLTGGLVYYANPNGNSTAGTSVAVGGEIPVSGNFTLQRLHVKSNAAAGAAQSTSVTLYVNGVGTPIIATISGASATTASDDIDTVNVSADDLVTVQINPTATSGATGIAWSFEMVAR